MFVGAYVARTSFIIPAIFLSTLGWAFAIHFLNQIAHAAGQHDLADVIAMNLVGLLIGIVGALLGAIAGHRFYSTRSEKVASTN